jgi:signal transduction histidine kinase
MPRRWSATLLQAAIVYAPEHEIRSQAHERDREVATMPAQHGASPYDAPAHAPPASTGQTIDPELRHELLNALNVARGYSQILARRLPSWASERERHAVLAIVQAIDRATTLLGQPSEGARPCDLSALLSQAPHLVPPERADDVRVRLPLAAPLLGPWDADRLTQILANLLSNAAKYSRPGSPIEVELRHEEHIVQILVRDHGIGVAPSMMPHLFTGRRAARARRLASGDGLGLQICARLVGEEQGRMWALSQRGAGSTFVVELPWPPAALAT